MASSQSSRVIVVTGANRGIGWGIVRRTVADYRTSHAYAEKPVPLKIYLTSRNEEAGLEAIKAIKADLKDEDLKLASIEYHQLDLSDSKSKDSIIKHLQSQEGGLDVLINNAGIALDGFDAEVVRKTLEMNYTNVTDFNERVLPILKPKGRIIILASMAGSLNGYSKEIVERFRSVKSKKEADQLAKEYEQAAKENIDTLKEKGWKTAAYSVSKVSKISCHRIREGSY